VNYCMSDGICTLCNQIGGVNPFPTNPIPSVNAVQPGVTMFGGGVIGNTAIQGFIAALRQNNLMRTLADPNLIAMSGQEASFLAGGEFPVPVPQSSGSGTVTITVDYKEFGVRLKFVPIVLGD